MAMPSLRVDALLLLPLPLLLPLLLPPSPGPLTDFTACFLAGAFGFGGDGVAFGGFVFVLVAFNPIDDVADEQASADYLASQASLMALPYPADLTARAT